MERFKHMGYPNQHKLMGDPNGEWVRYDEAQAEIARLQAEVERLTDQNRALLDTQIPCACGYDDPDDVCLKHHPAHVRKVDTAWNDAIEAAADIMSKGGLHTISDRVEAIRALKREASK